MPVRPKGAEVIGKNKPMKAIGHRKPINLPSEGKSKTKKASLTRRIRRRGHPKNRSWWISRHRSFCLPSHRLSLAYLIAR